MNYLDHYPTKAPESRKRNYFLDIDTKMYVIQSMHNKLKKTCWFLGLLEVPPSPSHIQFNEKALTVVVNSLYLCLQIKPFSSHLNVKFEYFFLIFSKLKSEDKLVTLQNNNTLKIISL